MGNRLAFERLEPRLQLTCADLGFCNDTGWAAAEAEQVFQSDVIRLAGEGIGTVERSPTGELAQLLWREDELLYRVRRPDSEFDSQVVTTRQTFSDFSHRGSQAQLLHRVDGTPVVLVLEFQGFSVYEFVGAAWEETQTVEMPQALVDSTVHFAAELGPDDSFHVIVSEGFGDPGSLVYGTNLSGAWEFSTAATPAERDTFSFFTGIFPRYVSLGIDDDGFAHIAYTPEFIDNGSGGFSRPFDQLAYATNRSGRWQTEIVHQPSDDSGQSGVASSLAIASNGQPAISQFFVDRVSTGSASGSQLLFHQRLPNGNWTTEVVANRPDGYVAGDGARFTGFAPHLMFDDLGRPHIAFSDHASQHFDQFGADEFAGQIRHAVKENGRWALTTVFRQSDPLREMVVFPTMAILPNELVFVGLRRTDQLDQQLVVTSTTYDYIEVTQPQAGLTIQVNTEKVFAGQSVEVTVTRHHIALAHDLQVRVSSSQSSLLDSLSLVIPSGRTTQSLMVQVGNGLSITEDQIITVSAEADGLYPGTTVLVVKALDLSWQNPGSVFDVNDDGRISALDALRIINWIAVNGGGPISGEPESDFFPDVSGNAEVTALDALLVINQLELVESSSEISGEQLRASIHEWSPDVVLLF